MLTNRIEDFVQELAVHPGLLAQFQENPTSTAENYGLAADDINLLAAGEKSQIELRFGESELNPQKVNWRCR